MSEAPRARFYRPELDRLRFGAFFAVYCCHSLTEDEVGFARFVAKLGMPAWFDTAPVRELVTTLARSLATGVSLFFVLSSYLITTLLLAERTQQGQLFIKDFYVRRGLRIWPLYFVYLGVGVATGAFLPSDAIWFALFVGNWHIVLDAVATITPPLGILWSVCIEEQFYVVWPLLLRRATRRTFLRLAAALLVVTNVVRLAVVIRLQGRPAENALWYDTLAQLDPFVAGSLIAFHFEGRTPRWSAPARVALTILGLGAILWAGHAGGMLSENPSGLATVLAYPAVTIGASLLLLATLGGGDRVAAKDGGVLPWLGRISYGLYVLHEACIRGARWIVFKELELPLRGIPLWALLFALGLVLTIGAATISYYALEKPFLRWKLRFTHVPSRPGG